MNEKKIEDINCKQRTKAWMNSRNVNRYHYWYPRVIVHFVPVHFVFLQLVLILFESVGMGMGVSEGESEGGGDDM
jgi:hypothetical protein